MNKEFVPYELALRMKALGFDEPCFRFYWEKGDKLMGSGGPLRSNSDLEFESRRNLQGLTDTTYCSLPTWHTAFRWFRDEHYAFHEVFIDCVPKMGVPLEEDLKFSFTIHFIKDDKLVCGPRDTYRTQEEAELACLDKLIEIVEQK